MGDNNVLITGCNGFLGSHTVKEFIDQGFDVYCIGRGKLSSALENTDIQGFISGDISTENLKKLTAPFKMIIHCAGGSSVGRSLEQPNQDFNDTVATTATILEYIRLYSPKTKLVYISSAAVYGEHDATPIDINDTLNPTSPYGCHKKMAEDLTRSYSRNFDINCSIIRFFSIYGPGLRKQLIWDACNKLQDATESITFWGTGNETRDWIYISDATRLIYKVAQHNQAITCNGGIGIGLTIQDTLTELSQALSKSKDLVKFNGAQKSGDPCHYQANIKEAVATGWAPETSLKEGLRKYASWYNSKL